MSSSDSSDDEETGQERKRTLSWSERKRHRKGVDLERKGGREHQRSNRKRDRYERKLKRRDKTTTPSRERGNTGTNQKIPWILCDKFGDKATQDFEMFEKEFDSMCKFYVVPKGQKIKRLLYHLEGSASTGK